MLKIANIAIAIAQSGFGLFGLTLLASAILHGRGDTPLNLSRMAALLHLAISTLVSPLVVAAMAVVFSTFGYGLIPLPSDGLWAVPGFLAYLLAADFLVYALHRAQHKIPFLWAMHSLHHAETRVTIVTAYVNYWAEAVMENVVIYPLIFIVFKVPALFVFFGAWLRYLYNLFNHAEIKLHFGPAGYVLVGPQYHRLHHSTDPAHFNKNFTAMFPLWDWMFGTLLIPRKGQFPVTGLTADDVPANSVETLWWPLRKKAVQEFQR